jgi:hypothetical protein
MILRFKPSENDFDVTFDNWNTTHKTQFITYIDWADGGHGIRAAGGGIQADK